MCNLQCLSNFPQAGVAVVGRILSARSTWHDASSSQGNIFRIAWLDVPSSVRPTSSSQGNIFLFQFDFIEQVTRILERVPRSFNNHLMVMIVLNWDDSLTTMDFSSVDFFIHMANALIGLTSIWLHPWGTR